MENNENVKHFVESFVKFDENVKAAQEYIKETYNINQNKAYRKGGKPVYFYTPFLRHQISFFIKF